MVIPRVEWAMQISAPGILFPSPMVAAHGLMAYRKEAVKESGCVFQNTSIGEDDLFIMCFYYNGMRISSVGDTVDTLVLLVHGNNIWNNQKQPPIEGLGWLQSLQGLLAWGGRGEVSVPPPDVLVATSLGEDYGDLSLHKGLADSRPPNRGLVWMYDDKRRPWWYISFHRMPPDGPWPRMTNSKGCPLAHLLRLLDPSSGTTILYPRSKARREEEIAGEGGERKSDACREEVGDAPGGFNGTHCLLCRRDCHYFNGIGCLPCTRCSAVGRANGVNIHVKNCTRTEDTRCIKSTRSPFHLGVSKPIGQRCGWSSKGSDGSPGICDRSQVRPCCHQGLGICSNGVVDCNCDQCVDFRKIPWRNDGICDLTAAPQPVICDPYGTSPCCVNGKCMPRGEKADYETPTHGGRWATERCFTPQRYLEIARQELFPIWESPPTEEEIQWRPATWDQT